jgi:hypothetical protein
MGRSELFVAPGSKLFERLLGLIHVLTGLWPMYLMFAVTVSFAAGFHWTDRRPPLGARLPLLEAKK